MHRLGVVIAVPLLLASCGPGTPTSPEHSPSESASTSPSVSSAPAAALTCGTPDQRLVEWSKVGNSGGTGPIDATTLVPAATTPTGMWAVLGIERRYVHDDGTDAGGASRTFALVNGADADEPQLIPIGSMSTEKGAGDLQPDWSNVSWTGETLAAGKKALAFANDCLDDARAGKVAEP